jgi:hypothetical protein
VEEEAGKTKARKSSLSLPIGFPDGAEDGNWVEPGLYWVSQASVLLRSAH